MARRKPEPQIEPPADESSPSHQLSHQLSRALTARYPFPSDPPTEPRAERPIIHFPFSLSLVPASADGYWTMLPVARKDNLHQDSHVRSVYLTCSRPDLSVAWRQDPLSRSRTIHNDKPPTRSAACRWPSGPLPPSLTHYTVTSHLAASSGVMSAALSSQYTPLSGTAAVTVAVP